MVVDPFLDACAIIALLVVVEYDACRGILFRGYSVINAVGLVGTVHLM